MKSIYQNFANLLYSNRLVNFSPVENLSAAENADYQKEQANKELDALLGPGKGLSKAETDEFVDKETKGVKKDAENAAKNAKDNVAELETAAQFNAIVDNYNNVNEEIMTELESHPVSRRVIDDGAEFLAKLESESNTEDTEEKLNKLINKK